MGFLCRDHSSTSVLSRKSGIAEMEVGVAPV